jgi:glycosyltransferase involved in cell wall biosynthesis
VSIKARVLGAARNLLGRIAVRLPADSGPALWRDVVSRARVHEARRLVRSIGDYAAAERVIVPLLEHPGLSSRAWAVRAELLRAQGATGAALAAARRSTASRPIEFEAVELHNQLAALTGHAEEARDLLELFLAVRPRNRRQFCLALEALTSDGDPELVDRYRNALNAWGVTEYDVDLRQAADELRLAAAHAVGREQFDTEMRRILKEHDQPVLVAIRALIRRQAWGDLASYLDANVHLEKDSEPAASQATEVIRDLAARRVATRALKAGRATAAVSIARHVLAFRPNDAKAAEAYAQGSDQLSVIANGWPMVGAESTPYKSRPNAVLSVLAQSLPVTSGGYATRTHGLLTGISGRGWDVRAVTRLGFPYDWWRGFENREAMPLDVVDGIPYHRLYDKGVRVYPQYPLRSYVEQYARRLMQHAVEHRASIIHAASFYVNGLAAAITARRLGIPYIYEMRGLEDLMRVSRDPSYATSDRYRFLITTENAACRDADIVLVITDALRREMIDRGVPDERIIVLPNGVDVERFRPRERDAKLAAELGIDDKIVIGYAGGLVDYEGLNLLLEAAAMLKSRRDDFHVVIVGDGSAEQALRDMAVRLQLEDVITFTGRVPHSKVNRYISLFDITPFPRLPLPVCELISPIKPFEAMAMGKAVVASTVAALTEIVDDGKTGAVFRKGSAEDLARVLGELLDSPTRREELGQAARTWVVAERDWSKIVTIVEATYRDLLDPERRTRTTKSRLKLQS